MPRLVASWKVSTLAPSLFGHRNSVSLALYRNPTLGPFASSLSPRLKGLGLGKVLHDVGLAHARERGAQIMALIPQRQQRGSSPCTVRGATTASVSTMAGAAHQLQSVVMSRPVGAVATICPRTRHATVL